MDSNVGCSPFVARVPPDCGQLSRELFFLVVTFGSGSGSREGSSFCPSLRMPLTSMRQFNAARNIYCLSWLKSDKMFERVCLLSRTVVRS